ncbi:MAG TPA: MFS transporter [Solirubrobacterales bacterium]|jgi:EmrB/QacA subfamily drug resistance transporter
MAKRSVLLVLSAAQFLMVLDQSVMNVSISQLVEDFDTTVTTIQGVITLYSLTMAALMITGGKLGDILGRRRAFSIGMVIYGFGSLLTALSWSVPALAIGWSLLEGIGAALVLPALVALTAANFEGKARAAAYGTLGGVAGAGIAVGPILGGWVTTNLTWRLVFAGEVVLVVAILLATRLLQEPPTKRETGGLDWVGSVLSALGLALIVFGVLQASNWGWLQPRNSPITPFGFSLVPFVVAAGGLVVAGFRSWQRHREHAGLTPLVRFQLFRIPALRSGLGMFLAQNAILMGIFFTVPLYLQVVQGYDAFKTGVQMLPVSIAMLIVAMGASRFAGRWSARAIVRAGLGALLVATVLLISTIEPRINTTWFAIAMALIGIGMGLIVSQLQNAVQSAVTDNDRSEAGGLQYTAQQLGAALGTALIGAVLITGLLGAFSANVADHPGISADASNQVGVRLEGQVSFVDSDHVRAAATESGLDETTTDAIVESYSDAQLQALKTALLAAGFIVVAAFFSTRSLPTRPFDEMGDAETVDGPTLDATRG